MVVVACVLTGLCLAAQAQATLYRCPGNLFTNDIDARSAREQGCVRAQTAGWSQGAAALDASEAAQVPPIAAVPAAAQALPAGSAAASQAVPRSAVPVAESRSPGPAAEPREARSPVARPVRVEPADQRERDRDALAILQAELRRTLAEQQSLAARTDVAAESATWQRLRADEQALRRELARFTR